MENDQILLETKLVGDIKGTFFVPKYQRGYRWGEGDSGSSKMPAINEVRLLLDDIYNNGEKNYCLQPIVLRKREISYELIDGQQRLTTLYLIFRYMKDVNPFFPEPSFSLIYETRINSAEFLSSVDMSRREENIDFWFIANAYETIKNWFEQDLQIRVINMFKYLKENVNVIWYEVDTSEDEAMSIFTRLNIGKIPLTSAELVKATFLGAVNKIITTNENNRLKEFQKQKEKKQHEIALQWDNIERELRNDSFWCFLNDNSDTNYQTRIDLVLDLIAETPKNNKEKYYTFFEIERKLRVKESEIRAKYSDSDTAPDEAEIFEQALDAQWNEIQKAYLILKNWYTDHELYHKIGYLIASGALPLLTIFKEAKGKTKHEFRAMLNEWISKSITTKENYADLEYNNSTADYNALSRLLLLFNVESVRQIAENSQRFPFDKYKDQKNGVWSLEHIHAQNSEGIRKVEQMKDWLKDHIASIRKNSGDEELINDIQNAIDNPNLEGKVFENIQGRVIKILSSEGITAYLHTIGNLALLKSGNNAALNNSTFDVKRSKIIQMDRNGEFIPFCTRNVFLKYYTPSDQLGKFYLWEDSDRIAYIKAINKVLDKYLKEPIRITNGSNNGTNE